MRLYLDMDGVLADFIQGVCDKLHFTNPWTENPNLPTENIEDALGYKSMRDIYWNISAGDPELSHDFWANLPVMEGAAKLVSDAEKIFGDDIFVLSCPAKGQFGCCPGKVSWIEKHFPQFADRYAFTRCKWAFAHRKGILIDDFCYQIARFNESGGIGIHYPARNNVRRGERFNLRNEIQRALNRDPREPGR